MQTESSNLNTLLDTLSVTECRAFHKWLASPYHNQRSDLRALFESYETARKKNKPIPDKVALSEQMFPGEPYDDHRIRMAMSLLLKQVESFLAYEMAQNDTLGVEIKKLSLYRSRKLPDHFHRQMSKVRTQYHAQPHRHPQWHWQGFEIELEDYLQESIERRTASLNVQATANSLDFAYLALKLRQSCAALSHQAVYKADYDFGLLPTVLAAIEEKNWSTIPAFAVYYHCYLTLSQPENLGHFERFQASLFVHEHDFPPAEMRDLYLLAINVCIQRYNQGNRTYLEAEMVLYQRGLSEKILFIDGYISRFTYRNVVSLGLTLEQFEETERFVETYKDHLEPRHRDANYAFNLARLKHERGQYYEALILLQKSEYKDLLLNLAAKALLIKIYYDTDEDTALDSLLDAVSNFVRRKKELSYHRDNYLNLCKFIKKIKTLRVGDTTAIIALKKEIEATPVLAYKDWLLKKIGEMEVVKKEAVS